MEMMRRYRTITEEVELMAGGVQDTVASIVRLCMNVCS